jgi:hypothetical protein
MKNAFLSFLFSLLLLSSTSQGQTAPSLDKNVPNDLKITLTLGGTIEYQSAYTYIIKSDGTVVLDDYSRNLPTNRALMALRPRPEELKRSERLSAEQLMELVRDFESSDFFSMNERYYGDPTNELTSCVNHAEAKALSFAANGKAKSVSFFLGCNYGDNSPLKSFLQLYEKVSAALRTVKATSVKK